MTIKVQNGQYCVYSEDGSKRLGCHKTREEAEAQLAAIHKESGKDKFNVDKDGKVEEVAHFKEFYGIVLETKEDEDGSLIVKGYIATTHVDDGNDRITKETLDKWAKEINEGNPRANKVSVNHNREPHVAGKGIPGTAQVIEFPDGEHGLYVHTKIDKTREDYTELKYRIEEGFLDSFSIEYIAPEGSKEDDSFRLLDEKTELFGWTLASQPMNPYAVMIKESYSQTHTRATPVKEKQMEATQMAEEKVESTQVDYKEQFEKLSEQLSGLQEFKEKAEAEKAEEEAEQKEAELKAKAEAEKKELIGDLIESKEFQEKLDSIAQKSPALNAETKENNMSIEVKEYNQIFEGKEFSIEEQFKRAIKVAEKEGLLAKGTSTVEERMLNSYEYKNFMSNGAKLEAKGLGIGSNEQAAYVDDTTGIGIAQAELQDVVDPVLYNALNDNVTLWGVLRKENKSTLGSNRYTFVLQTSRNATAGAYTGNTIALSNSGRDKYVTKFKKYGVGFAVDGDLIAANRGSPLGEVLALEIARATEDLKKQINTDLFTEQGLETGAKIIGLKYLADSAGNTTLYGVTRSAANKLSPDAAADTYINGGSSDVTKAQLRAAIKQIVVDGGNLRNIIFVAHPTQNDKIKTLYDSAQQLIPTSSRFGFEGQIEFEGVPVFVDVDSPESSLFAIDLEAFKVAMWVPPTVEMLGKRNDSSEGFIKSYFATYSTAPRRIVEIYDLGV